MRAVVVATGSGSDGNTLGSRYPLPMLPLLDRPFVQHVLEFFAGQGVREFDFILSHLPDVVERHLGDGSRWGCRLTYHLARDPERPYAILSRLGLEPRFGERLLLGHADRLPVVQLPRGEQSSVGERSELGARRPLTTLDGSRGENMPSPVLFVSPGRHRLGLPREDEWTGWGLLTAQDLLAIPRDLPAARLYAHLRSAIASDVHLSEVTTVLGVRSAEEMLEAQRVVLEKQIVGLMFGGLERAPRVWVAGSAKVSPTAELFPPVFIGPHCTVGAAAQLGPQTVISAGCLIDRHCRIRNSSVLAGSYVGEGMVLEGTVIDKDLAVNARANSSTLVADPLALGRVPTPSLTGIVCWSLHRLFALALLIATAPLLLVMIVGLALLRGGRVFHSRVVVRLPLARAEAQWSTYQLCSFAPSGAGGSPARWRPGLGHLLLEVLPGLIHVVRGELHFVGASPRSPEQVSCLPHEWRALYLNTKAGLVSASAILGSAANAEDQFAADAAYAVNRSWRQDLRMLAAYLWQAFRGLLCWPLLETETGSAKEDIGTSLPGRLETLRHRSDEAHAMPGPSSAVSNREQGP